jgi:hypothetical protein
MKVRKISPRFKNTGPVRQANPALVKADRALSSAELDQVSAAGGMAGATIGTNT